MPNLAFIDIETTGHDPVRLVKGKLVPWHEVIDIGCVLVNPATMDVLGELEWKVKPLHPERCVGHPAQVTKYHERAAAGEWRKATDIKNCINWLLGFIESHGSGVAVPGGQNFFFDWTFLTVAFALAGYSQDDITGKYLHYSRFDTRSMAIQELRMPGTLFNPDDFSIRSELLVKQLGIEPEPKVHTAINGARKSFEVFKRLEVMKRRRNSAP